MRKVTPSQNEKRRHEINGFRMRPEDSSTNKLPSCSTKNALISSGSRDSSCCIFSNSVADIENMQSSSMGTAGILTTARNISFSKFCNLDHLISCPGKQYALVRFQRSAITALKYILVIIAGSDEQNSMRNTRCLQTFLLVFSTGHE